MKKKSWALFLYLIFSLPRISSAVPAYPGVINFRQPDASSVSIKIFGDEHFHRVETVDGYTLLMNKAGFYEYAVKDSQGGLIHSGIIAHDAAERSKEETEIRSTTVPHLQYSPNQINILKQAKAIYSAEQKNTSQKKAFPATGSRKLLCILMGFTDKAFTKNKTDFENLFNQVGYTTDGATGSVKDYYLENSWNQLSLDVTVAGPYTASQNMAYYGGNNLYGNDNNPQELVTEAVNFADSAVNFADFDNDGDGKVDSVYVIFAGYGEEAGGPTDAIWSHAWGIPEVTLDGKIVSRYSCSPELRDNSGSGITRIGVICHEFGHVMGAPDYYDTDYAGNGYYQGTDEWDLMAGGSWNGGSTLDTAGRTPAHHNGFTKTYYYKWATMTELTSDQSVTVPKVETDKAIYFYNSPTTNEYWLLENRQQTGFDAALPGHGLMIYHVQQDQIAAHEPNNDINATHPQYMYPVCSGATTNPNTAAGSYGDPNTLYKDYSYNAWKPGSISSGACPFPGTRGKTAFSYATIPSARDWSYHSSDKIIKNIIESAGNITFDFSVITFPPAKNSPELVPILKMLLL